MNLVVLIAVGMLLAGCATRPAGPSQWSQAIPLNDRLTRLENRSAAQDAQLTAIKRQMLRIHKRH